MQKTAFLFVLACCTLYSCVKAPNYPIEPKITFVSVSSPVIKTGVQDTITFSFTDGDGDVGIRLSADSVPCPCCRLTSDDSSVLRNTNFNIFLIDSRDLCVQSLASANVPSSGKFKSLEGEIQVIHGMDTKKCVGPFPKAGCPLDTAIFYIMMRDQAGHFSNFIQTSPIVIDAE